MILSLEKYSFGTGDRFAAQGNAQLSAINKAREAGIPLVPVWNKSHREHRITGTSPAATWHEAYEAVQTLQWEGSWFVDADHINLTNVDGFLDHANFFTIDVADYIGKPAGEQEIADMLKRLEPYLGGLEIPGIEGAFDVSAEMLETVVRKFYGAVKEAALIYRHIEAHKGAGTFITEVSMDEVEEAQTPFELFFILVMAAHFQIPVQTIAPKFTGRFNKGVDYQGNLEQFRKEFEEDLLVISLAVGVLDLPSNLKLSIHSGSDKFSIYPVMGELIRKHDAGIHVKTAGTTWLEEVIGLAIAGGEGLEMARSVYRNAFERREELCAPYASVIDIPEADLPSPSEVDRWSSEQFADTLRHIPGHPRYNPAFRQLIHVGYKVAAEAGTAYTDLLEKYASIIGKEVEENLYERHIQRLFS